MTYAIYGETIVGNVLLQEAAREPTARRVPLDEVNGALRALEAVFEGERVWVKRLMDGVDAFSEHYPLLVTRDRSEDGKEFLIVKASVSDLKRHFYDELPPRIAQIFDDFYRKRDARVPSQGSEAI